MKYLIDALNLLDTFHHETVIAGANDDSSPIKQRGAILQFCSNGQWQLFCAKSSLDVRDLICCATELPATG
jgi:hypothetical protein